MKRKDPLIEALRSHEAKMDPRFAAELRKKVLAQASEQFNKPRVSALSHLFESMKKYSIQYAACLLLIAMGVTFLVPKNLNPEEVLANAAELYENQTGIYYEKVLGQSFQNDEPVESILTEYWSDDKGNHLTVAKNPDTEEVLGTSLGSINEFGENLLYETSLEVDQTLSDWYKTYLGEKIFCLKVDTSNKEFINKSLLSIAMDDPSVYSVFPVSYPFEDQADETVNIYQLDENPGAAPAIIEELKNDPDYVYSEVTEEGHRYHVFSRANTPQDISILTYIDTKSFRVVKQITEWKGGSKQIFTFLGTEVLGENANPELFSPEYYEGLVLVPMLGSTQFTATGEPFEQALNENGCFNHQAEKLSEEESSKWLTTVPVEAIQEWEEGLRKMNRRGPHVEIPATEFDAAVLDGLKLFYPTEREKSSVSQGFHDDHSGMDFVSNESNEGKNLLVYAAQAGTVLEATEGLWNGGYGNSILIEHENGIRTFYSHLQDIEVEKGQSVEAGMSIGTMGNTGRVYGKTGIHLHFELSVNGNKIDPGLYLDL